MITRRIYSKLKDSINQFPAVALIGPRQVGKTTLALEVSNLLDSIYLDLESNRDQTKLTDPELYLSQHRDKLVILDEVHRLSDLFQNLRGLIDQNRRSGKRSGSFLLLGSASIDLLRQSGESLAGRISYLELNPFDALEIDQENLDTLWIRGGFPDSFLAANEFLSFTWRQNFIRTYLERDIPQFGPRIPAETLRRFWTMLAHEQAGLLNLSKLARNLGVDGKTVANYLDLLVDLLLVRRLQPWHKNAGKRLVKSPKVYIRDTGINHALLGLKNIEDVLGHPTVGASWESFVIENLLSVIPDRTQASFYRATGGAEADLILTFSQDNIWAIEIKRSLSPTVGKGFYYACEDVKATKRFIVYPGLERFPIGQGIEVINLVDLMNQIQMEHN